MHYADTTADLPKENIEMTRNQVYGVPLNKGQEDIAMEENLGYGVTNQVCGVNPLTAGAGQEAAADIPMEENVGYGVTNQVCGVSPLTVGAGHEAAADIPMEENVGYGITNQVCGVFPLIAGTTMKNS